MLIFAHRGASADAPENTLLAMLMALEQQVDGIEIDVHQLGDHLVVIHDQRVARTTNGIKRFNQYTLAELQGLDAGLGEKIPTLWQVLKLINGRCMVNIELKSILDLGLIKNAIEQAIAEFNFSADDFIVSSFDHLLLQRFQQLNLPVKVGALTASKPLSYAYFAEQLNAYSVNVDFNVVDQCFIKDAKARGLKFFVYTVDEPEDLLILQEWGVDGVFCNGPAKARSVLMRQP